MPHNEREGHYRWDSVTREHCLRRIRRLRDSYRLHWLVEQHTFNIGALDQLDDNELAALLRDVEKARECSDENIPFEDAGLIRSVAERLPSDEDYQS
ncbi:hypothetical protein [Pseudoxanthomonas winnipegensis]|uniref:Uncharacterized protein n=1 Tax=Pseudoxanthomonas winnipegensis TaxID=2480810 RepID=A0A4Q8M8K7_9GAMM|nr:hypothetical protein [Pseudoxanthomonas winnipegensis]TAA45667.1 hypothetical protein EA655_05640 [Pseudoxanthomonas winnipegensis]